MNPADKIECAIEAMHLTTSAKTDQRILADSFAALEKATQAGASQQAVRVRRITITSPVVSIGAVAAAIMIVVAVFFNRPAHESIDLLTLYKALSQVTTVSIVRYTSGEDAPFRELASRNLNVSIVKLADRTILWDLANAARKTKDLSSDAIKSEMFPEEWLTKMSYRMRHNFALTPFPDFNDMPADVQWARVADRKAHSVVQNADVYDLTWTSLGQDAKVLRQRYFVDRTTNLPARIENYSKASQHDHFMLQGYEILTYPDDDEVEAEIRHEFGSVDHSGSWYTPEYTGTPESYPRTLP